MTMLPRRTFLKIAAAAGLVHYAEPLLALTETKRWITDHGDYITLRIPAGKTFAKETLPKPAIIIMEGGATMRDVQSKHFMNIAVRGLNTCDGLHVDGRNMVTETPRSLVLIRGSMFTITGGEFYGGPSNTCALELDDCSNGSVTGCNFTTEHYAWGRGESSIIDLS